MNNLSGRLRPYHRDTQPASPRRQTTLRARARRVAPVVSVAVLAAAAGCGGPAPARPASSAQTVQFKPLAAAWMREHPGRVGRGQVAGIVVEDDADVAWSCHHGPQPGGGCEYWQIRIFTPEGRYVRVSCGYAGSGTLAGPGWRTCPVRVPAYNAYITVPGDGAVSKASQVRATGKFPYQVGGSPPDDLTVTVPGPGQ